MIHITFDKPVHIYQLIEELGAAGFRSTTHTGVGIIVQDSDDLAAVTTIYNAHNPTARLAEEAAKQTAETSAVTGFQTLPAFLKTMTADEVVTHIHGAVLGGKTEAQINADIDGLANTVAGMKIGLKTIGASLIAIRDILELVAKLLLYIRDLVLKYRN